MLYQTRNGIYSTETGSIIAKCGDKKSRLNPHGFVGDKRVNGFWKGIRSGDIPHSFVVKELSVIDNGVLEEYGWAGILILFPNSGN